jgi:hypothetical protein
VACICGGACWGVHTVQKINSEVGYHDMGAIISGVLLVRYIHECVRGGWLSFRHSISTVVSYKPPLVVLWWCVWVRVGDEAREQGLHV